jgi:PilZ domain
MSDRRKEPRRKLMAFTPVYDLHPRTLLGYLGDLTLRGALVVGDTLITINKETELEIQFPNDLPEIPRLHVRVPARIAWCRFEEGPQDYHIGVEFTEVTLELKDLIENILARYHFRHVLHDDDLGRT